MLNKALFKFVGKNGQLSYYKESKFTSSKIDFIHVDGKFIFKRFMLIFSRSEDKQGRHLYITFSST